MVYDDALLKYCCNLIVPLCLSRRLRLLVECTLYRFVQISYNHRLSINTKYVIHESMNIGFQSAVFVFL